MWGVWGCGGGLHFSGLKTNREVVLCLSEGGGWRMGGEREGGEKMQRQLTLACGQDDQRGIGNALVWRTGVGVG